MSKQTIIHRGLKIKSPGHLKSCEALEELELAYCLESPLVLPGDPFASGKKYRKADLIVFNNDRHLFVEIDGKTHDKPDQIVDDYMRDYYLFRSSGSLSLRFAHSYVLTRPLSAAGLIWSHLSTGSEDHIVFLGSDWPSVAKGRRRDETMLREKEWKRHEPRRYAIGESVENFDNKPEGESLLKSSDVRGDEKYINTFLEQHGIAKENRVQNLVTIVRCMIIDPAAIEKYILLSADEGPSNESVIDYCEYIVAGLVEGLGLSDVMLIEEIRRIALARTKERLISENRILPSILSS